MILHTWLKATGSTRIKPAKRRQSVFVVATRSEIKPDRHEDFQSSCRSGTMCAYRSLLVSIQAFNAGYRFEHIAAYSSGKVVAKSAPTIEVLVGRRSNQFNPFI